MPRPSLGTGGSGRVGAMRAKKATTYVTGMGRSASKVRDHSIDADRSVREALRVGRRSCGLFFVELR